MNSKRLAQALNTIAMGFAEAAEALNESPAAVGSFEPPPHTFDHLPQPNLADESVDFAPQGHEAICPKHHVPYTEGQYGPYCKEITDDPAWGKQKGDRLWCRISPKNAAEYLRIKAAA